MSEAMTELFHKDSYYVAAERRARDHGEGRTCHMGERCRTFKMDGVVGKISRYATLTDGRTVLLCPLCENDRIQRFLDPNEYLEFGFKERE
jgi:hypothetical protein